MSSQIVKIEIPPSISGLSAIIAACALAGYVWQPKRHMHYMAMVPFLLLAFTVGWLIVMTGGPESPYRALWVLLAVLSGVFGLVGMVPFFATVVLVAINITLLSHTAITTHQIANGIASGLMPLILSFLLWYDRQESSKTAAIDALARQLSQAQNKSEIVINAIADGVIAIDEKGVIQLINPAAQTVLGWNQEDSLGLDYRSIFKLSDLKGKELADGQDPITQVLASRRPVFNNNLGLTTKSGKLVNISLVVSPVSEQETAGAIAVFRDITEEKREERARAEFVSTASHEMRTPVAAIEGYLGLALNPNTAAIDDKARAYLEKAHESTQHLGRLFQDLLTVSRAEDGRLAPKPSVIDLNSFIKEITDGLLPKAQTKSLNLQFVPGAPGDAGDKTVAPAFYSYVDRDHLREVVNNLVDNAIKYTKQGGVTVNITGDEANVTVSITDTGIGIPPEDLPHLFQKFYRVDESYTREVGGTGLGLYICRRLIENNNGKVWAESEYGHGSTFFVQIPRISHDKAASLQNAQAVATAAQQEPAIVAIPQPAASITQPAIGQAAIATPTIPIATAPAQLAPVPIAIETAPDQPPAPPTL